MDAMDVLNGATLKRPTTALPQNLRVSALDLGSTKKLKRMPHLFTRVLELPLHDETPVRVVESIDSYRFEVYLPGVHVEDVNVEVLEIVPGATKVLVRGLDNIVPNVDVEEVNLWRFRLPPTTVPENSVATYDRDTLSVTIPKIVVSCNDNPDTQEKSDGESSSVDDHSSESEEERMQRQVLEDLESFGSPRRARSSPQRISSVSPSPSPSPNSSSIPSPRALSRKNSDESEIDQEKLQQAVLEDLECFGSPRRSASCTQALNSAGSQQDFFRSMGSWVGGFSVYVQ